MKSGSASALGIENLAEPRPQDICSRSFDYALRAIKLYQHLQAGKDGAGWANMEEFTIHYSQFTIHHFHRLNFKLL